MTDIILFLVAVALAAAMAFAIGRAVFVVNNVMKLEDERADLLRKQLEFMTDKAVKLERALMKRDREVAALREAGQAVVERWHTPLWKDVEATAVFIQRLEKVLRT